MRTDVTMLNVMRPPKWEKSVGVLYIVACYGLWPEARAVMHTIYVVIFEEENGPIMVSVICVYQILPCAHSGRRVQWKRVIYWEQGLLLPW